MKGTILNPFWLDVIDSFQKLQNSDAFLEKEIILATHLWFNNRLKLQLIPSWHAKDIMVIHVGDLLTLKILPIEDITE